VAQVRGSERDGHGNSGQKEQPVQRAHVSDELGILKGQKACMAGAEGTKGRMVRRGEERLTVTSGMQCFVVSWLSMRASRGASRVALASRSMWTKPLLSSQKTLWLTFSLAGGAIRSLT